jgi:hypothetical protein
MNKTIILTMVFALLVVGMVSAAGPALVTGTVTDGSSVPVSGATVSITCMSESATTSTDVSGNYIAQLNNPSCIAGSIAYVTATKDGQTGHNSGAVCAIGEEGCDINVAFVDVQIPEFGLIAASVAVVGALGIFIYRRKD